MPESTPGKPLLAVQDAVRRYGLQTVLDGVSVTIHAGDRIGLIGRNGSGKSTLMRILAGVDPPDAGGVVLTQGVRRTLLAQSDSLSLDQTVGAVLAEAAAPARERLDAYHALLARLSETPAEAPEHAALQAEADALQSALHVNDGWNPEQAREQLRATLALPPPDRPVRALSGGERRRLDLAARLLEAPDVLLLDEPTNHIDTESVAWMEQFLERYDGSCMLVTHDRYFLDRVVNRIVEIEDGKLYSYPGNYTRFLEYKAAREEVDARTEANRRAFLRRELVWLKRGPKARTTKQKARIDRIESAREQGLTRKRPEFVFAIPESRRLGKIILEAHQLSFAHGDRTLIRDFSFFLQEGMRVGIVGPNGAGKTTLLRMLLGEIAPDMGHVVKGDNTDFVYVSQEHDDIDPAEGILDYVSNGTRFWDVGKQRIFVPTYLEKFLFDKSVVHMPIGELSGGERNRLALARQLLRGGNVLVLDEPTNDLDLYTLRVLEEAIEDFEGCALIVSHDRFFLNRVCTHLLAFLEDGEIALIPGGYDDYRLFLERRRSDTRRARTDAAKAKEKSAPGPARAKRLAYHEKGELAGMEERILAAETRVEELEAAIQNPEFFRRDTATTQATLDDLARARAEVETLYARWSDLESRA